MKNLKNNDIIAGLVIFLIGIYILFESIKLLKIGQYYDSPGLLPAILSVVVLISSITLVWNGLKKELQETTSKSQSNNFDIKCDIKKESLFNLRILVIIIITTIYIVALSYTNFLIASIPFLFILMVYLKSTNLLKMTVLSVLIPLLIQYVFKNIFNQMIP